MASPDLTQYIDLTLDDRDAQDIYEAALADLRVKMPNLTIREGDIVSVLLEVLALEGSEAVFRINRLPSAIVEVLVQMFGITRGSGTPPVSVVTFNLADTLGHTIPQGTRLRLTAGGETLEYLTSAAGIAPAGATSVNVAIVGQTNTDSQNGVAVGTPLELLDSIAYVNSVVMQGSPSGGGDPETSDAWLNRAVTQLQRLNSTIVLPQHFSQAALADTRVVRATTIDNHNGTTSATGHVAVAVLGANGVVLSTQIKNEIEANLEALAMAGLDVHVINPNITTVNVTATLKALPGYSTTEVQTSAQNAIKAYLNPDAWPWASTVYVNELIGLLDRVTGVDRVVTIATPASDTALSGIAPLAKFGTVSVTVQAA